MLTKIIDFLFRFHILWMCAAYLAGRSDWALALILAFVAWVIEDYLIGLLPDPDPDPALDTLSFEVE